MARSIYRGTAQDGQGRVMSGAIATVYLAGTTTVATVYDESAGGSAITDSQITTNTNGYFEFYVDTGDYGITQKFKLVITLTGYVTLTWDNIPIFRSVEIISAFAQTLLDDTTAGAAQVTLELEPGVDIQAYDATLAALAALATAANKLIYATGSDTFATTDLTAWARTFLANSTDADGVADLGILALNNDWTAGQFASTATLTDGAVALDYQTDMVSTLLLEENSTLGEPSNKSSGDVSSILLFVTQDGTGSRTLSFNAAIDFAGHDSAVNLEAGKTTVYYIFNDGTQDYARRVWYED